MNVFLLRYHWHNILVSGIQHYNIMIQYCVYCDMMTTISLEAFITIHRFWFFLLVMRMSKIHSLNNFKICNTYSTANYGHHAGCYIHMTYLFCKWKSAPFDHISPISLIPYPHFWQVPICSLYLWAQFRFVLGSTYKWDHTVLVFLWWPTWLVLLYLLKASDNLRNVM